MRSAQCSCCTLCAPVEDGMTHLLQTAFPTCLTHRMAHLFQTAWRTYCRPHGAPFADRMAHLLLTAWRTCCRLHGAPALRSASSASSARLANTNLFNYGHSLLFQLFNFQSIYPLFECLLLKSYHYTRDNKNVIIN